MGTVANRKLAVITGASSGIGFHLAKECAQHGFDVVICAEDEGILEAGVQLAALGGRVDVVQADLSGPDGVETLCTTLDELQRPVDALLINAGVGVGGPFLETELEDELAMIGLNCASVVHLAKRVVPAMVNRGQGRVMITASIASTAPAPYLAVYGATKAFDLSFAEALRKELAGTGVTVTALQPGPTDTHFFERAHMEDTRVAQGRKDDPADVAAQGFAAMMAGTDSVIASSLKSKLQGLANEILPETVKATVMGLQNEPRTGRKG